MSDSDDQIGSLIDDALAALVAAEAGAGAGRRQRQRFHRAVDDLEDLDGLEGPGRHRPEREVGRRLRVAVDERWERGWEPADLVHVVRRQNDPRLVRLATATITATLADPHRLALLPTRWRDQCAALSIPLADPPPGAADELVIGWRQGERIDVGTALEGALQLVALLFRLPDLDRLGPPPSQWTTPPPDGSGRSGRDNDDGDGEPADPKLLTTIRALLAKAESTSFPAEAEAFAAKAQALMTSHAIDAAALAASLPAAAGPVRGLSGAVRLRRFPIDDPYGAEKAGLLSAVADLNDVRVVWDGRLGLATLVGFPSDLDLVELLVTSLLIQATRAVNDPANASPDRRAPAFRRAFLLAYADRIAHRLQQAHRRARLAAGGASAAGGGGGAAPGAGPLPVLAARREAVDTVTDRLFPGTSGGGTRLVDARGWEAGRRAADQAHLHP